MGKRISYFKNNFDKGLKDILFENYSQFRQWYLDFNKSSEDDFLEAFGNEKLKGYFNQEKNFQTDFENLDKKLIDELTAEFIATYFDLTHQPNMLEFFGPTKSVWRYEESNKMVFDTKDVEFIQLWQFLTEGRSLKDNLHFNSYTNDYKIGFLNQHEYLHLKSKIELHFGDIETIRNRYWTNKEKTQFEKVIRNSKDNSYTLSGHNPKSSGLEFVLDTLNELTDKNKELIIGIEV